MTNEEKLKQALEDCNFVIQQSNYLKQEAIALKKEIEQTIGLQTPEVNTVESLIRRAQEQNNEMAKLGKETPLHSMEDR